MLGDFYEDQRFCASCDTYVFYLLSPRSAYCATCGARVTLLSATDMVHLRDKPARQPGRNPGQSDLADAEYHDAS